MSCDPVLGDRSLVAGEPVVRVHANLDASLTAAGQARAIVASALVAGAAALPADVVSTAQLLASELVTNAVLHARTDLHVGIAHDWRTLLIAVSDGHPATPPTRGSGVDLEASGRGMAIVASIADDFGWRARHDVPGKIMWVLLELAGATGDPHDLGSNAPGRT